MHIGVQEVPSEIVLKRWTINARSDSGCELPSRHSLNDPDAHALHDVLYTACMELLSIGRSSRQAFEIALGHVSHAKCAILVMKVVGPEGEGTG
jgi:hypothetical protein